MMKKTNGGLKEATTKRQRTYPLKTDKIAHGKMMKNYRKRQEPLKNLLENPLRIVKKFQSLSNDSKRF